MSPGRKWRVVLRGVLAASAVIALLFAVYFARNRLKQNLPHQYSFSSGLGNEWSTYDGTWTVADGVVRNDSDERGAKIVSGSTSWKNYAVDSDIELLGDTGDAGIIVRSANEQRGVDSYSGYYAGLRVTDGSLIIGRGNYDWTEYQAKKVEGGLRPFHWYHLKVIAVDCMIAAHVTDPATGQQQTVAMDEGAAQCATHGRIGLRSVSVGGAWRNLRVAPATKSDLLSMLGGRPVPASSPLTLKQTLAEYQNAILAFSRPAIASEKRQAEPISDLRLASLIHKRRVLVRGEVILTQPVLYIQDATGGASVVAVSSPPLKVGDDVEVEGTADPHEFSSTIRNATVKLLWPEIPDSPLSITAFQAATGAFAGRFVELQGILDNEERKSRKLTLAMHEGDQHFQVVLEPYALDSSIGSLKPGSLLLIRGICVTDAGYTKDVVPFVLLLRSTDDVQIIGSPPWWSARNLVIGAACLVFIVLLGQIFYARVEQWRLHAVTEERQRLAHELHDTLAQSFAGIGLQLRAIRRRLPEDPTPLRDQIDIAVELVRQGHQEARHSISTLRPDSFGPVELLPALNEAAKRMLSGGAIDLDISAKGDVRQVPLKVADVMYRAGIEAIANAVRHAQAKRIAIELEYRRTTLLLSITDDGQGFTVSGAPSDGFGLFGIRRRLGTVGGAVRIVSGPEQGTRVEMEVPLSKARWLFHPFAGRKSALNQSAK